MREKLIELLRAVQYQGNAVHGYHDKYIQNSELADHLIDNGVTVQQWIPVSERLPKEERERYCAERHCTLYPCLCAINNKVSGDVWVVKLFFTGRNFISNDGTCYTTRITHWMPLPELPKGE